ncbi:MAG TPA: symmetrical bis(5'-nucleosyl)-tetraphosphatase [Nevskiaceae bacterium]
MATYAIGDVQGCLDALHRLLTALRFDARHDRVWFTGDLVNRGPDSLGVLRFVRSLGTAAISVLGNHDFHLLAVAEGAPQGRGDTLDPILHAPDRNELLEWLAHRPLLHHDERLQWTMVHAGLAAQWDLPQARLLAQEVEARMRGTHRRAFLQELWGDEPHTWRDDLRGVDRLRVIVNVMTRIRFCNLDGGLSLRYKGPPGGQPAGTVPWFQVPGRRTLGQRIVFGHWAALGRVAWSDARVWGIDTGCVWGNRLSALCLETGEVRSCGCTGATY